VKRDLQKTHAYNLACLRCRNYVAEETLQRKEEETNQKKSKKETCTHTGDLQKRHIQIKRDIYTPKETRKRIIYTYEREERGEKTYTQSKEAKRRDP